MTAFRIGVLAALLLAPAAPPAHAADLYFQIVGVQSAKCLDVGGVSHADGANVVQWSCLGLGQQNQLWRLVPAGAGFQIVAKHSGKCLDVGGVSTADGADIVQWSCVGATQLNQLWLPVPGTDQESFQLIAVHSQKCADVAGFSTADGGDVYQWTCTNTPNQHWYLVGPFLL